MAYDELGTDFSCGPDSAGNYDLTDDLAVVDGGTAYLQCVCRSLQTEGLFYAPHWGRDMTRVIGESGIPMAVVAQMVEATCAYDRRTRAVRYEPSIVDEEISGPCILETDRGPHEFTLSIDATLGKVLAVSTTAPDRLMRGGR